MRIQQPNGTPAMNPLTGPVVTGIKTCPFCGGGLIEQRLSRRCVRCNFMLCIGCEGGSGSPECDVE